VQIGKNSEQSRSARRLTLDLFGSPHALLPWLSRAGARLVSRSPIEATDRAVMAQPARKSVAGLSTIAQKWSRLPVKSGSSFSLLEEKADATSASLVLPRGRGFFGSSPAQVGTRSLTTAFPSRWITVLPRCGSAAGPLGVMRDETGRPTKPTGASAPIAEETGFIIQRLAIRGLLEGLSANAKAH
jgi:hypothetical protein